MVFVLSSPPVSLSTEKKTVNVPSGKDEKISDFITSLGLQVEVNVTDVVDGELDIWVPEKRFAVEFNSLLGHSEDAGKTKWVHYNLWKSCKENDIQLVQVWEDEWINNPGLIKRMLAHKMGVNQGDRTYARQSVIVELSTQDANTFLDTYHIQGSVDGSIRFGLVNREGVLVAVIVFKVEPGTNAETLNLLRFATSQPVVGGFTKLLKHVEKIYNPSAIVTFSDNMVSDGALYKNNGFVAVKELHPDYKYVTGGERIHKFRYRLKRFRNDPDLLWDETLSERELARLNNLPRIWDAGKTKWEKQVIQVDGNN